MPDYPPKLLKTFKHCRESDWTDKAYNKYRKEADKYLKGKKEDKIEQAKLTLALARIFILEEIANEQHGNNS